MTDTQRAACIIGWPAKHSRSPKLHGYWIREHGLNAVYRIEEVPPDGFAALAGNLGARGYAGANVTIPHKEAALALSRPDARAKAVGAANTLWLDNGVLRSTNTDVEGFLGALDSAAPGWDRRAKEAVVLGAGGVARAAVYGLIERGIAAIHVANRTAERARAFRGQFGAKVQPAAWPVSPDLLARSGLLVNATSLGMHGQPPLEIDLSPLPNDAVVMDLVYVPLKTDLLARAEARGLAVANGLDMLLHQAVRGFELWFGVKPRVSRALFDMLAADIAGPR